MLKRTLIIIVILTLVVLSGCSFFSNPLDNTLSIDENKDKKKSGIKDFVAAKNIEGMLREGPGIYAGDEYDQKKVEKGLDKFPKDITAEDAYNRLIYLLAEDYEPLVDELKNLDMTYTLDRELPSGVKGDTGKAEGKQVNVAILLDASGSMNEKVSGGVKMDLAKKAIQQFASDLPEGVNVSLRVFGHKEGKSKKESCQSSETVYPLSSYDKNSFDSALNKFGAQGWTPLAKAIRDAKEDLSSQTGEGVENIVYVVSDGEETCGGDPVKEAKVLHTSDMKAIVNIIGFDVSNREQRALKEVAKVGGGSYKSANSAKDLEEQLRKERKQLKAELRQWAHLSGKDVTERKNELLEQGDQLRDLLYGMNKKERQQLLDATKYLSSRGIRPEGLGEKLRKRHNEIHGYIRDLSSDVNKKIVDESIETLNKIIEKEDEIP